MRYLIIGLGIYGSNLAIDLTNMGHEVIGADKNPSLVESIKDYISTAYIIDSTDEVSLSVLPLKNVDLVIVAIGENFGASIRTVAILKKIGVKHIYARAIDKLHESILEGFSIDRIITPEQRAASDLVNEMSLGNDTESLRLDDNHYIIKFRVPEFYVGMRYSSMDLYKDFSLQLITAMRKEESRNLLGIEHKRFAVLPDLDSPDLRIESGDMITCMGTPDDFRALFRHFNK
jgi:hypothetical protein